MAADYFTLAADVIGVDFSMVVIFGHYGTLERFIEAEALNKG